MDNHNRNGDFSEGVSEKEILQKLTSSQSNERLEALEDLSQLIKGRSGNCNKITERKQNCISVEVFVLHIDSFFIPNLFDSDRKKWIGV
jgi:hypothetical protein